MRYRLGLPVVLVAGGDGFLGRPYTARFLSREAQIQDKGGENRTDKSRAHVGRLSTLPLER